MLHLIAKAAERLLPAPLHRALLPLVFRIRHRWRKWRKADLRGCAVIIANSAGEILLLRHSYGPEVWALPGGGIDADEDPADAAIREIAEELGMALTSVQLIAEVAEVVSGSPHTAYVFAATSDAPPQPDQREVIEARFFAPDSLPVPLGRVTAQRLALWREWGIG
jgi:ADP-ribose pyrophosphatase YjhB (NUDIX family)